MKKNNVEYYYAVFCAEPQQIIRDESIVTGKHFSTNKELLIQNMIRFWHLFTEVHSNKHNDFFNGIFDNLDEFTSHLKNKYANEYRKNHVTLINLTFSEN
jgi:hypothetical protein